MTDVHRILHPTDFSEVSTAAAHAAADFARRFGARLHVLNVVPAGFDLDAGRAALHDAVMALGTRVAVIEAVEAGIAAPTILEYARAHDIDLIVMGTHGRTGVSHLILGSVAEAVVRRAPCPVLTIPASPVPSAPPAPVVPPVSLARCVVCTEPTTDLICGHCRARIRGEALEHKWNEERAGRMAGAR